MNSVRLLVGQWPLAITWLALALPSVVFTRFEGGVAHLWGASAVLIASLIQIPRRAWWAPLTVVGFESLLTTGLFGLGWIAAPFFVVINVGEGVVAALIMRRGVKRREVLANLSWFGRFLLAAVLAPAAVAPLAGFALWLLGQDAVLNVARLISGHALGNMTVLPIVYMLTSRSARRESKRLLKRKKLDAWLVLPAVIVVDLIVFAQTQWPLLFLPLMFVLLATFRLERLGASISLVILALIGGILTSRGLGPIALAHADLPSRVIFFQFFIASTVLTILPVAADLTQRRKLLRSAKRSEAEFRLLAEHCTDVIMRIAPDGRIRYASPSVEHFLGYSSEALIGTISRNLIHPDDLDRVIGEHQATLRSEGAPRSYEYRSVTRKGEVRWFSTHARSLPDEDGKPAELLAIIRDVTAARQMQEHWQAAALMDQLTCLPNRRALETVVARLSPGEHCLALLDLDHFKTVNDTYGHHVGDQVLISFAKAAKALVRSDDAIFRLGGEEFVLLFENCDIEKAFDVCDRLRAHFTASTIETTAGKLKVTVSGGVAKVGDQGLVAALKSADEALYNAKRLGRDRLQLAA
jgi:diguanylate cyclase (GGDEF)-like protein/PAS domain S-box-containing protein